MKDDSSVTQSELGAKTTGSGTPAPWQVGNYNPTVVYDANPDGPISVATCSGLSPSEARANARRIVACVNACAGLSTKALEKYPGMFLRIVECAEQRDELAAALRDVLRIAKAASIGVTGNARRIERAEVALAKL